MLSPSWREISLDNQERGKSWDYQVISVNKAGEEPASNIVTAVLRSRVKEVDLFR